MLLWSGGAMKSQRLTVPHKLFATRDFVLRPLVAIARTWRDPMTGFTVAQLATRLRTSKPVDRARPRH